MTINTDHKFYIGAKIADSINVSSGKLIAKQGATQVYSFDAEHNQASLTNPDTSTSTFITGIDLDSNTNNRVVIDLSDSIGTGSFTVAERMTPKDNTVAVVYDDMLDLKSLLNTYIAINLSENSEVLPALLMEDSPVNIGFSEVDYTSGNLL